MTAIRLGKASKALTATHFVTKKVFKNQGVNHWSNFSGLTPCQKGRPQPHFSGNDFSRKICPGNDFFREHIFEKYVQKNPIIQKMNFLGSGTFKVSIASKRWCLQINSNFYSSHGDPNHEHFVKKHKFLASTALRKICVFPSLGQLFMYISRATFYVFFMSRATFSCFFFFSGDFLMISPCLGRLFLCFFNTF